MKCPHCDKTKDECVNGTYRGLGGMTTLNSYSCIKYDKETGLLIE